MSAPTRPEATETFVKQVLTARLDLSKAQGQVFLHADQFLDHLANDDDLDQRCKDWIHRVPYQEFREFLKEYHGRHERVQPCAAQAPPLNTTGASVPHPSGVSDIAYACSPGFPMDDLVDSLYTSFDVEVVPTAVPNANLRSPLRARVELGSPDNIIGLDDAKMLCGDRVTEGERVIVSCQPPQNGLFGTTGQMTCIVGRTPDVNIIFKEHPDLVLSGFCSGSPLAESRSRKSSPGWDDIEEAEFKRRRLQNAFQMAEEMTRVDMRRRKRPPEDDGGMHHLARRPRRAGQ